MGPLPARVTGAFEGVSHPFCHAPANHQGNAPPAWYRCTVSIVPGRLTNLDPFGSHRWVWTCFYSYFKDHPIYHPSSSARTITRIVLNSSSSVFPRHRDGERRMMIWTSEDTLWPLFLLQIKVTRPGSILAPLMMAHRRAGVAPMPRGFARALGPPADRRLNLPFREPPDFNPRSLYDDLNLRTVHSYPESRSRCAARGCCLGNEFPNFLLINCACFCFPLWT